jgi:transposase
MTVQVVTYEGYSESNLRWAVKKKQDRRRNILLYTKVSYISRLLLDIITLWNEALVLGWHEFLNPKSKKVAAKCEIHAVKPFLQAEGHSAAEIHCRMSAVCRPNFVSDTYDKDWCRKFRDERTDVHDEGGQGRPSLVTDDLVQHTDALVRERHWFTISELSLEFPQVSWMVLYEILMKNLATKSFVPDGCLAPRGATFFDMEIQKLVSRYDKCLNSEGDYVDK